MTYFPDSANAKSGVSCYGDENPKAFCGDG